MAVVPEIHLHVDTVIAVKTCQVLERETCLSSYLEDKRYIELKLLNKKDLLNVCLCVQFHACIRVVWDGFADRQATR